MAQSKILLDSNSYFRLARNIHPLLFEVFGEADYCLYVLPEMEIEYARSPRLQTQFAWVNEPEYRDNRAKRLTLSRKQIKERPTVYAFLWDHVLTSLPGPSPVDVTVLSYAYVLGIPVVTDDADMIALAKAFGITVWTTLKLMKVMLDCGRITLEKVRAIAAYWSYEDDQPRRFTADYHRLFGEPPP